METIDLSQLQYYMLLLVALGMAPFMAMLATSFIKLVVVLSLIRQALGIQQIPPNQVINGLAIVLSLYVMAPIAQDIVTIGQENANTMKDVDSFAETANLMKEPIRGFLLKHSDRRERAFFMRSAKQLWPEDRAEALKEEDLMVLLPAFTVSELTAAFQIGFLIYLPFIAIDLVVANILMAMGMQMMSPTTVSLPFKLLLFVLVGGWEKLIHGLVLTYA